MRWQLSHRNESLPVLTQDSYLMTSTMLLSADKRTSTLCKCALGKKYTGASASIIHSPHFESGVITVQHQQLAEMTEAEKSACRRLVSPGTETTGCAQDVKHHRALPLSERINLEKWKRMERNDKYMNWEIILGSVAEFERLCSIAKNILSYNRKLHASCV